MSAWLFYSSKFMDNDGYAILVFHGSNTARLPTRNCVLFTFAVAVASWRLCTLWTFYLPLYMLCRIFELADVTEPAYKLVVGVVSWLQVLGGLGPFSGSGTKKQST